MSISFSNPPVDLDEFSRLDDVEYTPVERSLFWLRSVIITGSGLILFAGLLVSSLVDLGSLDPALGGLEIAGIGLFGLAGLIFLLVFQWVEVKRRGYVLREHDFSFASGVFRTSVATIPFSRVQHVAIDRGLLVRVFGLANLRIRSAGGTIHVTGITYGKAENLKSFIVDRARIAADEEQAIR